MKLERRDEIEWTWAELACVLAIVVVLAMVAAAMWRITQATPLEQMIVAERTLDVQGWGAWPTCARKLGLR